MRNPITEEVYEFTYENWLSNTKGPKRTYVCELAAVVDEEEMVEKTIYLIQVQTSDIGGWTHSFYMIFVQIMASAIKENTTESIVVFFIFKKIFRSKSATAYTLTSLDLLIVPMQL